MNIYVASHSRELAVEAATALREAGHVTTSRWHDKAFHPTEHHTEVERREIAQEDYDDIAVADALAGPDRYSGGKFVEAGIAMGFGLPVTVVGRRENMLLWHPSIAAVENLPALLRTLTQDPTNANG